MKNIIVVVVLALFVTQASAEVSNKPEKVAKSNKETMTKLQMHKLLLDTRMCSEYHSMRDCFERNGWKIENFK